MGFYSTATTLDTTMIGITFDSQTTALAEKCVGWAEAEVNKYLSKRYDISIYQTTTASIPPLILAWTEQLAEAYMWQRLSRGGKESLSRGAAMMKPVIDNLRMVADDKLNVSDSAGSDLSDKAGRLTVLSNSEDYHSTFDEDDPLNWSVDKDKLKDIADGRD